MSFATVYSVQVKSSARLEATTGCAALSRMRFGELVGRLRRASGLVEYVTRLRVVPRLMSEDGRSESGGDDGARHKRQEHEKSGLWW
jgi:hypothetical protein